MHSFHRHKKKISKLFRLSRLAALEVRRRRNKTSGKSRAHLIPLSAVSEHRRRQNGKGRYDESGPLLRQRLLRSIRPRHHSYWPLVLRPAHRIRQPEEQQPLSAGLQSLLAPSRAMALHSTRNLHHVCGVLWMVRC